MWQRSKLGKMLTDNNERVYDLAGSGGITRVRIDKAGSNQGAKLRQLTLASHIATAA